MTNCSAVELIYSGEIEKLCLFQKEMKQRRIRYSNYFGSKEKLRIMIIVLS